jgi:hypothetical protein
LNSVAPYRQHCPSQKLEVTFLKSLSVASRLRAKQLAVQQAVQQAVQLALTVK